MEILVAVFLSFVPALVYAGVVYWLDRYEKEPLLLLGGVFLWGALVASFGAIMAEFIADWGTSGLIGSDLASQIGTSVYAPVIEETLKGVAVLIIFVLFHSEFDSIMDGIVYAAVAALGFAATENILYLLGAFGTDGFRGMLGLWFLRVVLDGWGHPFYTSFIGIGLATARLSPRLVTRLVAPLAGWVMAVFTHGLFNTLAGYNSLVALLMDWSGWFCIAIIIWLALRREAAWIAAYLREEVDRGLITSSQYRTACSSWLQMRARLTGLGSGRFRVTDRFYQVCGELAQKKEQLDTLGDEGGNTARIELLRRELMRLAPVAEV